MSRLKTPVYFAFLTLLSFAFIHPLAAQSAPQAWSITGQVTDSSGRVVPGATIVATNRATGLDRLTVSDADGTFVVSNLSGQTYRVVASLSGFAAATADVTAASGRLTLVLTPATHVERVTVVSGSRAEERRATLDSRVDVISRARLDSTARASVGEVLREVPGVVSRRGSEGTTAAGEQVQGIDSRQVGVLIDGQPIVGARGVKSGIINLDRQPIDQLERVEVVKGASSALFGSDAIGGVINLITRQPEARLELNGSGSVGGFDGRDAGVSAGAKLNRGSLYGALGRHQRDSFDLTPATLDTTGAAIRRNTAFGKGAVQLGRAFQLRGSGSGYWNRQNGRFIGEVGLQDSEVRERAGGGQASAEWQPATRTTLQLRAYGSNFHEDSVGRPLTGSGADEIGMLRETLFKTDLTVVQLVGERNFIQGGVEWSRNTYDGINRLRDDAEHEAKTSVAWLQNRINLFERATFTVGVRYDDHSTFGSEWSPKAGLNVRAAAGLHLRVSYGQGFRAPDLGQLYYRFVPNGNIYQVIGNPLLRPETSASWQYGADYAAPGGRIRFGINGFRNDAEDLIIAESLGFLTSPAQLAALIASGRIDPSFKPVFGRLLLAYRNVSDIRTQGVEFDGEAALGRGFAAGAAYTYLDAIDRSTGSELTGRHRHQGFARLTWTPTTTPWRAELRGAFYGSWLATATERADAFALWDAIAAWRVRPDLELFGAVDNLFNSQDPNTGTNGAIYRPEIGRTWRTGIRWNWRTR